MDHTPRITSRVRHKGHRFFVRSLMAFSRAKATKICFHLVNKWLWGVKYPYHKLKEKKNAKRRWSRREASKKRTVKTDDNDDLKNEQNTMNFYIRIRGNKKTWYLVRWCTRTRSPFLSCSHSLFLLFSSSLDRWMRRTKQAIGNRNVFWNPWTFYNKCRICIEHALKWADCTRSPCISGISSALNALTSLDGGFGDGRKKLKISRILPSQINIFCAGFFSPSTINLAYKSRLTCGEFHLNSWNSHASKRQHSFQTFFLPLTCFIAEKRKKTQPKSPQTGFGRILNDGRLLNCVRFWEEVSLSRAIIVSSTVLSRMQMRQVVQM